MADEHIKSAANPAKDASEEEPSSIHESTGADAVIITMAYIMYWSFLATCLVFPVATQAEVGPTLTILPALCGLASCSLMLFISHRSKLRINGRKASGPIALNAILSVPLLFMMAASAFQLQASLRVQAIGWLLWGIGQAFLLPLIGNMQTAVDVQIKSRRIMPMFVAGAFGGVALFALLALFAPDPFRSFLPAIYLIVADALCVVGTVRGLARDLPEADEGGFKPTQSAKILSPLIIGATFSVLICYCIAHYGMATSLGITAVSCLVGGGAIFLTVNLVSRKLVNAFIERCYFPITAASFFLISVLPDPFRIVPSCLAASMFFAYAAFHWALLIALARHYSVVGPDHFVTGLLSPAAGLCIGWAISAVYALANGNLSQPFALFFGWVVAYIIMLSIAPYASDPAFEIDMLDPDRREPNPVDRSGNTWERACEQIGETCKLSPREREVFAMLAHGRNVEYISSTLFISGNTAKTHKYRIYRKLGVNTHQELLDKVEQFEKQLLE